MSARQILILTIVGGATSCGPSSTKHGLDSPVSSVRIRAIGQIAEQGDLAAIPRLVELLNSDDVNVRFAAIGALERMTGQRFAFEPADPVEQRRAAIDRWVAAVKAGAVATAGEAARDGGADA